MSRNNKSFFKVLTEDEIEAKELVEVIAELRNSFNEVIADFLPVTTSLNQVV